MRQTILKEAARSGRMVVVAENHSVIGGLGEAVAGLLLRSGVTPTFRQIGLPDEFLDAGALPTLHERYGISAEAMARNIKTWLRKDQGSVLKRASASRLIRRLTTDRRGDTMLNHTNRRTFLKGVGAPVAAPASSFPRARPARL